MEHNLMRFGHIEIFVSDPIRSRQFYRDVLGFEVTAIQGDRFVWLQKEGIEILLRPGHPPRPASRYEDSPTGIVLYTDDLDRAIEDLKRRGLEVRGVRGVQEVPHFHRSGRQLVSIGGSRRPLACTTRAFPEINHVVDKEGSSQWQPMGAQSWDDRERSPLRKGAQHGYHVSVPPARGQDPQGRQS
jgi:catechol 2,3-dioxygenase-like lactoylglutathione lyase family enzyme